MDEPHDPPEPSWTTALTEAKSAARHVHQAAAALERLARELAALRERSETTARLDLARALADGPDGGALQALVAAASDETGDPGLRRTAAILLDRLTAALGLEPVCERGELLRLTRDDLVEFDLRGQPHEKTSDETGRSLYSVVRPGWRLEGHLVVRPLLEAIGE